MKKFNFIVGKKQIIIASLVLILGVAIYLNWQFASSDKALTVADVLGTKAQTSSSPKYGEAQLVDANKNSSSSSDTSKSDDYFTRAKMDKKASHDEASEALETILSKGDISEEEKANATAQSIRISEMSQKETSIEEQVKAKGFDDCVAYVENDRVNVTVKVKDLNAQQAAQIKDIIINTTGVDSSNIVVTPVS